jgi:tetratricopeptide (TPR) repeat protein
LYQRALALYERVLGPDHPHVATSLHNLAALYRAQGRYDQAEPLYQRALGIRERVLGPEHPDVAQSLNNLARLYQAQGRYGAAEPLFQRALALYERVLGPDHPDTATARKNYAILLQYRRREAAPFASLGRRIRAWLSRTRKPRQDTGRVLLRGQHWPQDPQQAKDYTTQPTWRPSFPGTAILSTRHRPPLPHSRSVGTLASPRDATPSVKPTESAVARGMT